MTIVTSQVNCNALRAVNSRNPTSFYKSHIKYLVVDEVLENSLIEDILSECHGNLLGLAWWPVTHNRKKWASLLLSSHFPSMRRLSVNYNIFPSDFENIFHAPIFQNLTHLDIVPPIPDLYFATSTQDPSSVTRKGVSWEDLQCLECLIHLHIDMKLAWSPRDPDASEKLRTTISIILSHLPHQARYLSICIPYILLIHAIRFPSHLRQFYDDLIWGRIDPRIVVGYIPQTKGVLVKESFSEYLLPRSQNNKALLSFALSKLTNDFWEEAEELALRRNKELYGGK